MKKLFIFFVPIFILSAKVFSQVNVRDSSIATPMIIGSYMYQIPGGDMAVRFGNNSNVGATMLYKTKKNWLLGAEGNYIFSNAVKESNIFDSIKTTTGYLIDGNGEYATVRLYERGFNANLKAGKLFPIVGPNPNSGLFFLASAGLLQHKIRIENPDNVAYQIKGDYKKGYDRLTNGFAISEYIGYMHLGNLRLVSFHIGFECTQAWTQSRREYDFDKMSKDTKQRLDLLYGIKAGWIIPLYKRRLKEYYYN